MDLSTCFDVVLDICGLKLDSEIPIMVVRNPVLAPSGRLVCHVLYSPGGQHHKRKKRVWKGRPDIVRSIDVSTECILGQVDGRIFEALSS